MKVNVIVHKAEEGGYWAEVPAPPGCSAQSEKMEDLLVREAIEGCLAVPVSEPPADPEGQVIELAV